MSDYTTWNPSDKHAQIALSDGNLTATMTSTDGYARGVRAIISKAVGKFYFEIKVVKASGGYHGIGKSTATKDQKVGQDSSGWGYEAAGGYTWHNNSSTSRTTTFADNDIMQVAVDLDNGYIWWGKNGTWIASGDPANGTNPMYSSISGDIFPMGSQVGNGNSFTANFGDSAFAHSVPSGFTSGWPALVTTGEVSEQASIADSIEGHDFSPAIADTLDAMDQFEFYDLKPTIDETGSIEVGISGQILAGHSRQEGAISADVSRGLDIPKVVPEDVSIAAIMVPDHLIDAASPAAGIGATVSVDAISRWRRYFPNVSGRRVVLKYIANDTDYGMELYYSRMKVFKTIDRLDDVAYHPNLTGNHLTLKIVSDSITDEESLLAYASIQIHARLL